MNLDDIFGRTSEVRRDPTPSHLKAALDAFYSYFVPYIPEDIGDIIFDIRQKAKKAKTSDTEEHIKLAIMDLNFLISIREAKRITKGGGHDLDALDRVIVARHGWSEKEIDDLYMATKTETETNQ